MIKFKVKLEQKGQGKKIRTELKKKTYNKL